MTEPMIDQPTQPLSAEDVRDLREVIDSQVALGHSMTLVPTDVLVRLLDAARAASLSDGLRLAAWRLSNAAESLVGHARLADDPAHRAWFVSAIGDVEREVRLARATAGSEPTAAEYRAAYRTALEATGEGSDR